VRRDTRGVKNAPLQDLEGTATKILDRMHDDMYDAARAFLASRQVAVGSKEELFEAFRMRNVFATAGWCGEYALEEKLKSENGLTIRCLPLEPTIHSPKCFRTGLPARQQVVIAKAY
jgi:prolyl-tRNA synthetase